MRGHWNLTVMLTMALGLAACATPPKPPQPSPVTAPAPLSQPEQPSFTQIGIASWYGKSHDGHKTASGEIFDRQAMTAAHKTLPFGAVIRVTNLANGKTIRVRINDRGPYLAGRIVDLSEAAAGDLGIGGGGIVEVKIEKYASDQPGH